VTPQQPLQRSMSNKLSSIPASGRPPIHPLVSLIRIQIMHSAPSMRCQILGRVCTPSTPALHPRHHNVARPPKLDDGPESWSRASLRAIREMPIALFHSAISRTNSPLLATPHPLISQDMPLFPRLLPISPTPPAVTTPPLRTAHRAVLYAATTAKLRFQLSEPI
jgi:hypothetical protein